MERISHDYYLKLKESNKDDTKIIVLCYNYALKEISYGLLKCDREEKIVDYFKDYNGMSVPFIYRDSNYRILKSDHNGNFILTRNDPLKKIGYKEIQEMDLTVMRRLVDMQRKDL